MRIEENVEIERGSEEVFVYVTNPARWSEWIATVAEVGQPLPGQTVQEGSKFVVVYRFLGRRFEVPHEVTALEPHQRLSYRSTGGPIPHEESFVFEALSSGEARCTHIVELKARGLIKVFVPLLRRIASRQSREDLQTLKSLMEAR